MIKIWGLGSLYQCLWWAKSATLSDKAGEEIPFLRLGTHIVFLFCDRLVC